MRAEAACVVRQGSGVKTEGDRPWQGRTLVRLVEVERVLRKALRRQLALLGQRRHQAHRLIAVGRLLAAVVLIEGVCGRLVELGLDRVQVEILVRKEEALGREGLGFRRQGQRREAQGAVRLKGTWRWE